MPPMISTGAIFFLQAFVISSWLTRLPDVLYALGIDKATLGLSLFAAPIGSMLAAPFAGRWIDRMGPGRVAVISGIGVAAGLALVAVTFDWRMLAAVLLLVGLINGGIEVAANAAADAVEKAMGVRIMARCHGFWSLGFMSGALAAGFFAGLGVDYRVHLPIMAAAGVGAFLALSRVLPAITFARRVHGPDETEAPLFALPGKAIAGLCAMTVGVTLAEGAVYDWGTLYLREVLSATPFWASVGYAGFTLAMAVGRFAGDAVRARVPAAAIIRGCALVAGAGMVVLVTAPNFAVAAGGLVLMGLGVSLVFPVAVSAVGARGGAGAASNMAALSLSVMGSLLLAPPAIGFVADAAGLGAAFAMLLPLIATTLVLAGEAAPRRRPDGGLSSAAGPA